MHKLILNRLFCKPLIVAAVALTTSVTATADDLDVFKALLDTQSTPNILFVLDYSGSMKQDIKGNKIESWDTTTQSKFEILESAVSSLLQNNKGKVNVGLGSTYNWRSSGVRWPISDLSANANKFDPNIPAADNVSVAEVIDSLISRKVPEHSTATVNALAEAAAYFRGDTLGHSKNNKPDTWNAALRKYDGGDDFAALPASYKPKNAYNFATDSWTAPSYESPLKKSCQSNFIVLISDGKPTRLNNDKVLDNALTAAGVSGISGCKDLSTEIFDNFVDDPTTNDDDEEDHAGNCGPEIVDYLAKTKLNPAISGSNVNTYTVGYAVDGDGKDYLELLAKKGQGKFYEADKPETLTKALQDLIKTIVADSQNFSHLSIDIDPASYSHDNRAYYSLFTPALESAWEGNLKGYFVDETGLIDIAGKKATVKTDTGVAFAETTQSFWSSTQDGNEIMTGGASESIVSLPPGPNNRNIYTYLGGADTSLATAAESRLKSTNLDIKNAHLGTATDAERVSALDWIANAPMGDPLHTNPVVVNYKDASNAETSVAYIMTNQGFIHAFDSTRPLAPDSTTPDTLGGSELFAFMPKELLSNLPELHSPTSGAGHVYGLDGPITRWHEDDDKDGFVNGTETVQLVFGMRRGGNSYYSLDVTDPNKPIFKWQITGGVGDFKKLAQTWSRASLISVKNGTNADGSDKEQRVLMFGGGYDAAKVDNKSLPTEASGNAVFMVDKNGKKVWSIDDDDGHDDMDYSIASDLTVIDTDRNGLADRAYFGDLGGQIWRVDFEDIATGVKPGVTKFADVKKSGGHQPIFYAPSVSMNKDRDGRYLAVAFGTGDRTQPMLDDSQNAYYMLRDRDYKVGEPAKKPTLITADIIYNATENDIGSASETIRDQAKALLRKAPGWVVYLNKGEKALSKVVTYDGKFLATTFEPKIALDDAGKPDPCKFGMFGRLYVMDLADARPVKLLPDGSETIAGLDKSSRIVNLNSTTIPSKPVVTFPADSSKAQVFVDKESVVNVNAPISTVFWHAK